MSQSIINNQNNMSLCSSCNHHASGDCVGLGRDGTYTWNTPVFPNKWENSSELDTVLNFIFPAEETEGSDGNTCDRVCSAEGCDRTLHRANKSGYCKRHRHLSPRQKMAVQKAKQKRLNKGYLIRDTYPSTEVRGKILINDT